MYSSPWKYRKSVSYLSCGHHHGSSPLLTSTLDFLTFDIFALSYVHKQLLSVVRTSACFFVCFNIWRLTFLPVALHCSGVLYYIYNIIYISYNVPFNFILIHFAFFRRWSCVFHHWNLVLRFPVPWIPPMRFGPVFSSPVFSTPAIWSHVFQSCVFHPRIFHGPAFSSPAFSASPKNHWTGRDAVWAQTHVRPWSHGTMY